MKMFWLKSVRVYSFLKKKICKDIFHAILRVHFPALESGPHTPVNIKSSAPPHPGV